MRSVSVAGVFVVRGLFMVANRTTSTSDGSVSTRLVYAAVWGIVLFLCACLGVGAVYIANGMSGDILEQDVVVSWALAAGVQWLLLEPMLLMLLLGLTLILRWCDQYNVPPPETDASKAEDTKAAGPAMIAAKKDEEALPTRLPPAAITYKKVVE